MFEVRVEADFSAAHFLKDYNGKCENLHGHNYKVYAHVYGQKLNEGGMLLDFTKIKSTLRAVCKELDHSNLNDNAIFLQNPSAERIAMYIYEKIIEKMKMEGQDITYENHQKNNDAPYLYAIDVFETDTSRARYRVY